MLLIACDGVDAIEEVTYTVEPVEIEEGTSAQVVNIPVRRSGSVKKAGSVQFGVNGISATEGIDFTYLRGALLFVPGSDVANIPITIIGDSDFELTEEIQVELQVGDILRTSTVTIVDDDQLTPLEPVAEGYITAASMPSMQTVWQEEFNGVELDASVWNAEVGNGCDQGLCGWGNNELQTYSASNSALRLEDGKLIITADRFGDGYRSARIQTRGKKEFTFGRMDIRARLPKGQGIWPAIWMLGSSVATKPWPACGEIDIMELVGNEPATVHGTVHYSNNGYATSTGSTSLTSGDFSDAFHVFTLVWQRNELTWYVDQRPFKTFVNSGIAGWPFNDPFYFILNVAVGGRWPGNPDQSTVFPQQMIVDYIRVFR